MNISITAERRLCIATSDISHPSCTHCAHTVPAIRRLRVGLGLLAEQGSGSIHARFNELDRNYHSIPNALKRLEAVTKQHVVNTLPQHAALCTATTGRR